MKALLLKLWRKLRLPTAVQLFIMHFLEDGFLVGVTGIFFNDRDEVLLLRHTYRDEWSLPGGYIKAGEHPKESIEREVREETGLIVSADQRMKIRTDRLSARLDITYMGSFVGGKFEESEEVSTVRFFAFSELPKIRKDQLIFIDRALKLRKAATSAS